MLDTRFIGKIRPDARKYCVNLTSPILAQMQKSVADFSFAETNQTSQPAVTLE